MSNLTETAYYTRKALKYGSILLVVFLILRGFIIASLSWWKKVNPPPPPPATLAFGKIPSINFPDSGTKPAFYPKLETVDNKLPEFPVNASVYFIPQQTLNLFTLERAKGWAKQIGFINEPEKTDDYNYVFKTPGVNQTVLRLNILLGNFSLTYNYQNDLTLVGLSNAPDKNQAIAEAKGFLQKAGVFTPDLASGYQEVVYFRFNPPNLEEAISLSEADFTQVNFFRSEIEKLKVLPSNPKKANVSFLISASDNPEKRILTVNYTHFPISQETSATYPLKKIDLAWQELQNNQAFLANFGQNFDGQVVVRKIYLAYFDPPDEQRFLEPIYVFEGDRDFLAYVSALDPKFTEALSPIENSPIPSQ